MQHLVLPAGWKDKSNAAKSEILMFVKEFNEEYVTVVFTAPGHVSQASGFCINLCLRTCLYISCYKTAAMVSAHFNTQRHVNLHTSLFASCLHQRLYGKIQIYF